MNLSDNHDPLDTLLHKQEDYIEDAGFTSRVMAALPSRPRRAWLRPAFLLGATAVGSVLTFLWVPWKTLLVQDPSTLLTPDSPAMLTCAGLALIVGALVWSAISAIEWES